MKKAFIILFLFLLTLPCYAIGSEELINQADEFNGKTIIFEGELVGDIMHRGDHVWLSVNDGGTAIGVFCKKEALPKIKYIGDYKHMGDRIWIEGIFHKACAQHGGDLDIHAHELKIIEEGRVVERKLDMNRLYISLLLFPIALILFFLRPRKPAE